MTLTRRAFLVASAASQLPAFIDPDFSIALVNDPQYLAATCSSAYRAIAQWIVDNQATVIDGSALNIKAAISSGDSVNTPDSGEAANAATAWGILDSNSFPWASAVGNHDMIGGADLSARTLAANFQDGGFFASDTLATKAVWGTVLPGGGGFSHWGSALDSVNKYFRLTVGTKRQLYLFLECHPRVSVLNWAQGIHDANPGYEIIVMTHSYLSSVGEQVQRTADGSQYSYVYGPEAFNQGKSPAATSGREMWNGSGSFAGFKTWSRLRMILCGHWIWKPWQTDQSGQDTGWIWTRVPIASQSPNAHTVQQLFANVQEADNTYRYEDGSTGPGACVAGVESAHLFLLKFCPSIQKLRFYGLSVHTGNWTGAKGTYTSATPIRLFEVDWAPDMPIVHKVSQ